MESAWPKLAATCADTVRSLTVIEPVAFHLLRRGGAADRRLYAEVMAIGAAMDPAAGRDGRIAGMRGFIDYWNGAGAWGRTSPALRDFFLRCHDRVRADFAAVAVEPDGLAELARIAAFPMRGANVLERSTGQPVFGDPVQVLTLGGVTVGLVALGYHNTGLTGSRENRSAMEFTNGIEAMRRLLPDLRRRVEVVVPRQY